MKAIPALIAALVYLSQPLYAGVQTGPVTNTANGHLYYLLTEDTWQNSEAEAIALGGHLTTINDQAEQDWVFSTFGSYGGTNFSLWIGLRKASGENDFQWANGNPFTYTNWFAGEPNNGGSGPDAGIEDYVHMEKTGNGFGTPPGFWNDLASPNLYYPQFDPICGVVEVNLSAPPLMSIRLLQGDSISVGWTSQTNRMYQVQYCTNLTTHLWLDLGSLESGNGTWNYLIDTNALVDLQRLYKVVLLP
jgi:hypothetical protein